MNYLGDIGESFAEYVLITLGYTVFYTKSSHCPFDMVISDKDNKLYKVQVKTTFTPQTLKDRTKKYYRFSLKKGSCKVDYDKSDLDYYICIAVLPGKKIVYMIPFSEAVSNFKLTEEGSNEKFNKYVIWKG